MVLSILNGNQYAPGDWLLNLFSICSDAERAFDCLGEDNNNNNVGRKQPFELRKYASEPVQSISNGANAENVRSDLLALENISISFKDNDLKRILGEFGPLAFYRRNRNLVKAVVRFKRQK